MNNIQKNFAAKKQCGIRMAEGGVVDPAASAPNVPAAAPIVKGPWDDFNAAQKATADANAMRNNQTAFVAKPAPMPYPTTFGENPTARVAKPTPTPYPTTFGGDMVTNHNNAMAAIANDRWHRPQGFADGGMALKMSQTLTPPSPPMPSERPVHTLRDGYDAIVNRLQERAPRPSIEAVTTPFIDAYDKTVAHMNRDNQPVQKLANGGRADMRGGGHMRGAGTGTSDSIPAMLSDGEYVLPADTVKHIGKENLDQIKDATHTPTGIRRPANHFAERGFVDAASDAIQGARNWIADKIGTGETATPQPAAPTPQPAAPTPQPATPPRADNFSKEGFAARDAEAAAAKAAQGTQIAKAVAPSPSLLRTGMDVGGRGLGLVGGLWSTAQAAKSTRDINNNGATTDNVTDLAGNSALGVSGAATALGASAVATPAAVVGGSALAGNALGHYINKNDPQLGDAIMHPVDSIRNWWNGGTLKRQEAGSAHMTGDTYTPGRPDSYYKSEAPIGAAAATVAPTNTPQLDIANPTPAELRNSMRGGLPIEDQRGAVEANGLDAANKHLSSSQGSSMRNPTYKLNGYDTNADIYGQAINGSKRINSFTGTGAGDGLRGGPTQDELVATKIAAMNRTGDLQRQVNEAQRDLNDRAYNTPGVSTIRSADGMTMEQSLRANHNNAMQETRMQNMMRSNDPRTRADGIQMAQIVAQNKMQQQQQSAQLENQRDIRADTAEFRRGSLAEQRYGHQTQAAIANAAAVQHNDTYKEMMRHNGVVENKDALAHNLAVDKEYADQGEKAKAGKIAAERSYNDNTKAMFPDVDGVANPRVALLARAGNSLLEKKIAEKRALGTKAGNKEAATLEDGGLHYISAEEKSRMVKSVERMLRFNEANKQLIGGTRGAQSQDAIDFDEFTHTKDGMTHFGKPDSNGVYARSMKTKDLARTAVTGYLPDFMYGSTDDTLVK